MAAATTWGGHLRDLDHLRMGSLPSQIHQNPAGRVAIPAHCVIQSFGFEHVRVDWCRWHRCIHVHVHHVAHKRQQPESRRAAPCTDFENSVQPTCTLFQALYDLHVHFSAAMACHCSSRQQCRPAESLRACTQIILRLWLKACTPAPSPDKLQSQRQGLLSRPHALTPKLPRPLLSLLRLHTRRTRVVRRMLGTLTVASKALTQCLRRSRQGSASCPRRRTLTVTDILQGRANPQQARLPDQTFTRVKRVRSAL